MTEVPAARSTLRIIRYLAGHSGPVRAATMSRDLGLPRSSVYHLLRVLQDKGFVVHSPEHQGFALTTPVLERLVAETKLPVVAHLGVLQHADVVYASKIAAARAPSVVTSIGVRLPAHLTATGRAMLSALPAAQFRASYPDAVLPLRTTKGPASVAELRELLEATRERGWATEDGDIDLAYASVAAAVLDHNAYPAAAVGLTFRRTLVDDVQWVRFGRAVAAAATTLSRRIRGHT